MRNQVSCFLKMLRTLLIATPFCYLCNVVVREDFANDIVRQNISYTGEVEGVKVEVDTARQETEDTVRGWTAWQPSKPFRLGFAAGAKDKHVKEYIAGGYRDPARVPVDRCTF